MFGQSMPSGQITAVLGPTNTGKTHYALTRLMAHATGMIGLPLRLLAREIYEKMVAIKGAHAVALITGEEKIIPRLPSYFVCTVEAMALERTVDCLVIDEIQLSNDAERGYIFTDRLLRARGRYETLFLGSLSFAPLFKRLFPHGKIEMRQRMSSLAYSGSKKLTRLPARSAIIAFSAENIYATAELLRRQKGGAAVVMGAMSPKTRNAQVALFENREVDYLVATDAIGMGLNMDVHHVAFSALSKFDGRRLRPLSAQECAQIAGRAGRYTRDGTFGVTAECDEMDEDLVGRIENHAFEPLTTAYWRNHNLSFQNPQALIDSLTLQPELNGLSRAKEAVDERVLRRLLSEEDIGAKATNPINLKWLWDVCQLPDFRKLGLDEHVSLVRFLFDCRLRATQYVPEEWFSSQVSQSVRPAFDVDVLSSRLLMMRTLTYIANRSNWLKHPEKWREETRLAESELSDRLHHALMQRFVDTRTSVLLKALNDTASLNARIDEQNQVLIGDQVLGHIIGLSFVTEKGHSIGEDKLLRQAIFKSVMPLLIEKLKELCQAPFREFKLHDRHILWKGAKVAELISHDLFVPKIKPLIDIDHPLLVARACVHMEAFLKNLSRKTLKNFWRLKAIIDNKDPRLSDVSAQARALAFLLLEQKGLCFKKWGRVLKGADELGFELIDNGLCVALGELFSHKSRLTLSALLQMDARHLMLIPNHKSGFSVSFNQLTKLSKLMSIDAPNIIQIDQELACRVLKTNPSRLIALLRDCGLRLEPVIAPVCDRNSLEATRLDLEAVSAHNRRLSSFVLDEDEKKGATDNRAREHNNSPFAKLRSLSL